MGFLYHAITIPSIITISFFFNAFTHARFLFIALLTRLGLYKPPPEDDPNSGDNSSNYILLLDGSSPSLVPIPVHVVTAAIKARVPVVDCRDFVLRRGGGDGELCELKVCSICLECVEWSDQVRELCRCSHLFHRTCLDTWIDEGQVTCPLCRSMMLPPKTNLFRCNHNLDGTRQAAA